MWHINEINHFLDELKLRRRRYLKPQVTRDAQKQHQKLFPKTNVFVTSSTNQKCEGGQMIKHSHPFKKIKAAVLKSIRDGSKKWLRIAIAHLSKMNGNVNYDPRQCQLTSHNKWMTYNIKRWWLNVFLNTHRQVALITRQ